MNPRTHRFPWIQALATPGTRTGIGATVERPTAEADAAQLTIDGPIGMWGISAREVGELLDSLVGVGRIVVYLNTPGGDAFDGVKIYNRLRRHQADVRIVVDGLAASAGSIIAMAGDEILMAPGSMMMVHNAQGYAEGDARDMLEMAGILGKANESMADIYQRKGGRTTVEWLDIMSTDLWLTAGEAVEWGLATAVEGDEVPAGELAEALVAAAARYRYDITGLSDVELELAAARTPDPPPPPDPPDVLAVLASTLTATPDYLTALAAMAATHGEQ